MQVGRTAFLLASIPPSRPSMQRNAIRMLVWLSASAVFWIAGGIAAGQSRLLLWAAARGIQHLSPATRFWVPRYGSASIEDWTIESGHMGEGRERLTIISV